jgi:hypothetical protein
MLLLVGWHADLTPRTYRHLKAPGPDPLHVGWLSKEHPFPTGAMLIRHCATAHRYRPPQVFIDAVLRNASSRWEGAWARDLCLSCGWPVKRLEEPREVIRGDDVRGLLLYVECPTCAACYPRFTPHP